MPRPSGRRRAALDGMLAFRAMRRRLEPFSWPCLAALGAVSPLLVVLLSGHTLVWRDTAQLYAPHRAAVVEAIRALRLPAWNPWEGTGQPLFAQGLHSVLHPVSIAVGLLTTSTDALLVILVTFAAVGAWAAARVLGCSPVASAGAALAFALSGYVLGMTANAVFLFGSASGPWAVAGLVLAARRRAGWLAAAVTVAALALSGDTGSLAAFTLAGAVLAGQAAGWRAVVRAALGGALGLSLAAVQLVPSWFFLAETARGAGLLDAGSVGRWALAPWRLLETVAPGFFVGLPRSYAAPVFSALGGDARDAFPFAPSVFVGAPVLLLAASGARRNTTARWLLALAALFLWLALGHHAGSEALSSRIPVWGALRYWEKMVGPMTLCLALAAGAGIDAQRDGPARSLLRVAAGGALLALLGGAALVLAPAPAFLGGDAAVAELASSSLQVGLVHAGLALAAVAGAALASRAKPGWRSPALVAILFLSSAAASPFALHAGQRAVLDVRPPVLEAAPPGPRLVAPLGFQFTAGQGGLDAIDLLQYWEGRFGRPSTNAAAHVDSLATYTGLTSVRWEMVIGAGELFWPLARRFGTTHVLARPPESMEELQAVRAATDGAGVPQVLDGGRMQVWRIPHRDWASFAAAARAAPGRDLAGALLGEELVAGRPTVVVEAPAAPPVSPGRVLAVSRGAEEVVIEAESAGEGLLVVNDAWSSGWRATIDGRPVEILPADVLVRAVRWPVGRHRLVMTYTPPGLGWGAAASGAALVLVLVAGLGEWRRGRGRGGAQG